MLDVTSKAPETASANTTILFFGAVSDRLGRSLRVHVPAGGVSLAGLKALIAAQLPDAAAALAATGIRAAVDQVLVIDVAHIHPGVEVAFFSAFSGG
ncbi:MAG: MoaD/ThiS family protein [Phenylobacterium sp.]|uniref:MoaD/ThiS family protein n=1 Tax=Phenylobacterium sp. TaxID=1871053 RepID=UPI00271D9D9E|nr:MoaD/ThiS family protein [Phenylobacterium sp.]MDO8409538.1 MoaD/ThiS family protein [Phenylobacterium sp.]